MDSRRFKPELSLFRTFECAARHESFTRAADELNLTQSAVSKQIIALEARLGLQLFSRVRRRVILTEAGRRFLIDVTQVLVSADEAILRALSASQREATLSIAVMPTFGSRWLAPRLGKFLAFNRNLHNDLTGKSRRSSSKTAISIWLSISGVRSGLTPSRHSCVTKLSFPPPAPVFSPGIR